MRMLQLAMVLLALVGCSSSEDPAPPQIDAPPMVLIDAPTGGVACTGKVYDPCTDNTQCMSGNCHLYQAQGLQICTQACTAGNNATCPLDKTGVNGMCNNMSICRPAAANACTR